MASVFLGLGSNECPEKNLRIAIAELEKRYGDLTLSAVYRNAAVGFDGDDFLNLVARFESDELPADICAEIERIHDLSGRVRGSRKWESRPLDIDLLLYNDLIREEPPVRVPRDDILRFAFVLRPLAEIAPDRKHPVTGKTYSEHWQEFDTESHPLRETSIVW